MPLGDEQAHDIADFQRDQLPSLGKTGGMTDVKQFVATIRVTDSGDKFRTRRLASFDGVWFTICSGHDASPLFVCAVHHSER